MRHVYCLIIGVIIMSGAPAYCGSDWRVHGKVCGWNEQCMKEQARARQVWSQRGWDADFTAECRRMHIKTYVKDYIGAVRCASSLQEVRDEAEEQARQEREAARQERRRSGTSGRSGQVLSGGKVVSY